MTKEDNTSQQSIDIVTELARTEALKNGGHAPTLIVTGTERGMVGHLEMPDTHEERAQLLFDAGFALAKDGSIGIPVQVFLITEGWMSLSENGELNTRPSEDPNRLEVLVIAGLHLLRGTHSLVVLEMIRDETEVLVELREHSHTGEDEQAKSSLLTSFVMGYYAGLGKDGNISQLPS